MRWLLLALLIMTGTPQLATANAVLPSATTIQPKPLVKWRLQKEKLQLKLYRWVLKWKMGRNEELTPKQASKAKLSMILGISSIAVLIIPFTALLALPAAVLAVVFGAQSLKGNNNTKGIVGVVTGGVTILLFIIAIAFVAAILAGL